MSKTTNRVAAPSILANVVVAPRIFDDASGAPAVLSYDGYTFACDMLGEFKMNCVAPRSGSRLASKIAALICRASYHSLLATAVTEEWLERNRSLYAVSDSPALCTAGDVTDPAARLNARAAAERV
jgi:hypothetical protein